jgi:MFS family permease
MLLFGDALGRRKGIIIGAAIMIVGSAIQVLSFKGHNATAQFIIGRVVTGVGNGMNTATIPTYQAECSRTKNHGLLICIEGGIIAFGTLIAYWIDFGCSYGPDQLTWRFPIAFQSVFGAILLFGMIWLPESPRWLLTKDRHEEAAKVIAALRGHGVNDEETRFEAHIIMDSIRASGHKGGITPFSALFTNGKTQHFRRMMLGASSQLMQQIGGCNAVIYYFPLLFKNSIGATHDLSLLLGGVNMIVYAIFATTSWFIIERTVSITESSVRL